MEFVYLLQHSYEYGELNEYSETKIIGIYSSREKAETIIQKYKNLPGFNEYDSSCFFIDEYKLDENYWSDGFVNLSDK